MPSAARFSCLSCDYCVNALPSRRKAGGLLERLGDHSRALDAYIRGDAWRPAVELARRSFPGRVVELERSWADWLVAQKQVDAAISHYIEAGAPIDAINAAFTARQYHRAVQLVQV